MNRIGEMVVWRGRPPVDRLLRRQVGEQVDRIHTVTEIARVGLTETAQLHSLVAALMAGTVAHAELMSDMLGRNEETVSAEEKRAYRENMKLMLTRLTAISESAGYQILREIESLSLPDGVVVDGEGSWLGDMVDRMLTG